MSIRISRRSVLRGGAVVGAMGTAAGAGLLTRPGWASVSAPGTTSTHLVADYRPSQPTGWVWQPPHFFSSTLGGHITSVEFDFNGLPARVSLLPSGDAKDPYGVRYEDRPSDPDIGYARVLSDTFGDRYSFRYLGGFPGCARLRVQSYSVFEYEQDGQYFLGGDIYVAYEPDLANGDPAADDATQWIQVIKHADPINSAVTVDNFGRVNPFYLYGGLTSIEGTLVHNFADTPHAGIQPLGPNGGKATLGTQLTQAETFLARDTGRMDKSGKDIVEIYGGVRWGWQATDQLG